MAGTASGKAIEPVQITRQSGDSHSFSYDAANAYNAVRAYYTDKKTGKKVFARFGRFGPMIQLGDNSIEGEELKFAPMPAGEKIETVTLEKAMQMFALPRLVGKTEDGDEITANIGQYGPYIKIKNLFVSIKPLSPF